MDQSPTNPEARRVPLANLITRATVGIAFLPFLTPMVHLLSMFEPLPARVAVNFHTLFSLVAAVVFLPLIDPLAKLARRLQPDRPAVTDPSQPRHLDPHVIEAPAEALGCAMRETIYLGDLVADMLRQTIEVFESNDEKARRAIASEDNTVDHLYEAIKLYLVQISRNELTEEESRRYFDILSFTTNLEHIGDIIDKNLMDLAAKKIKNRWTFSTEGTTELRAFHARLMDNLRLSMNVFTTRDITLARRLVAEKTEMRDLEAKAADSHFARLREGRPESIETSSVHIDVIRDFKRINGHLTSVAYPILEAAGELAHTRLKEAQPLMRAPAGS
jgi:phosphate:Na+ symporter